MWVEQYIEDLQQYVLFVSTIQYINNKDRKKTSNDVLRDSINNRNNE